MISKKTSKNQITLPKKIVSQFPECDYFDITAEEGRIVLRPVDPDALAKVQRKLQELGIRERDVEEAVAWARERAR
jgi:virulence-associated protein VagC